nr:MAG TPA: hypothetical protein [Caudoviricetes sp.]
MKCLVTKLQAVVDNDNLYKMNETRFIIPKGGTISLQTNGCKVRLLKGSLNMNNSPMSIKQEYSLDINAWANFKSLADGTILSVFLPSLIIHISETSKDIRVILPDANIFNRYGITSLARQTFDAQFAPLGYVPNLQYFGDDVNFVRIYNFNWDNFDIKHLPVLTNSALDTGDYYPVSNYGKHIGLTYINIQGSKASGTMESLGETMVKNGRTSGKLKVVCNSITNGTTWKGKPTYYLQVLYYKFDPSLSGGYEITDTKPSE